MIDLLLLVLSGVLVLAATLVPGWGIARLLGARPVLALAVAPAVTAGVAGATAIVAGLIGVGWNLGIHLIGCLIVAGIAAGLRRAGILLGGSDPQEGTPLLRPVPGGPWWVLGAALIAVVPLAVAARRADVVLERWDTLYHLSALRRIRGTGEASTLTLGSVSNSAGDPVPYPAAFHALASVVPAVPVPIVLNASVLVLAVVPWILGTAILARVLWPDVRWAAPAAGIVAALSPASPLNLWIHLSPIPNLVGFAALPGFLALAVVVWRDLLEPGPEGAGTGTAMWRRLTAALLVLGAGGVGLTLLHPNVAVTALILLAVLTVVTGFPHWRRRPWLVAVPLLALAPVGILMWTPAAAMVTGFGGGLVVPIWQGLGELVLGLLTVWPMPLGVVLAVLWWPGLIRTADSPQRWLTVAWLVLGIMYLDAAIDSTWNLSTLYYRGQDRISVPLSMIQAVLVVPGLQAFSRLVRPASGRLRRPLVLALVVLGIVVAGSSVPVRHVDASKNLAEISGGRGRFLQQDEREAFARAAPQMEGKGTILANPFTGAAHMYGIHGLPVHFPVAGMSGRDLDTQLMEAAPQAATDPAACRTLQEAGIGSIYQDLRLYARASAYDELATVDTSDPRLGRIVFETPHSRLVEIDCES